MINETRVRLMTRMSVYEEQEGDADSRNMQYFLSDYLGGQLLRSFWTGSAAFVLLLGAYTLYDFENMMMVIYSMDLVAFIKRMVLYYFLFLLAYSAVTVLVYYRRYQRSRRNANRYYQDLRKLMATYPRESSRRRRGD